MEPRSRLYRYTLRAAATLLGGTSGNSSAAPCRGAKYVLLRFKSSASTQVLSAASFNIGNAVLFFSGAGQSAIYALRGQANVQGFRLDGTGQVLAIFPTDVNGRFIHDYIQATFTAAGATPANDIAGFEVTAEVFYDDGFDQQSNLGQFPVV